MVVVLAESRFQDDCPGIKVWATDPTERVSPQSSAQTSPKTSRFQGRQSSFLCPQGSGSRGAAGDLRMVPCRKNLPRFHPLCGAGVRLLPDSRSTQLSHCGFPRYSGLIPNSGTVNSTCLQLPEVCRVFGHTNRLIPTRCCLVITREIHGRQGPYVPYSKGGGIARFGITHVPSRSYHPANPQPSLIRPILIPFQTPVSHAYAHSPHRWHSFNPIPISPIGPSASPSRTSDTSWLSRSSHPSRRHRFRPCSSPDVIVGLREALGA